MTASAPREPLIIGHRGASGYRPEHTRAAYELAFELGADAVEPDVVASGDGVLLLRHENEISGTTNIADVTRFAGRRTSKTIEGRAVTGWFTEDFSWAELSTLRARERLPQLRRGSAAFDDSFELLRLTDLLALTDASAARLGRPLAVVTEIKHASYFSSLGLPLDELLAGELQASGWADRPDQLIVESFEQGVLEQVRARGVAGRYVYLLEALGTAADLVARFGRGARSYASQLTDEGLAQLAGAVDGISVDRALLPGGTDLVDRAFTAGLSEVFTWTLRPENRFLDRSLRNGRDPAAFGSYEAEWKRIMALGVTGVFADHPDLAVRVRDGGFA